jgi:hypothetical protein
VVRALHPQFDRCRMAVLSNEDRYSNINVPLLINSQADSTLVVYQHCFFVLTMEPKDGSFANRKMALFRCLCCSAYQNLRAFHLKGGIFFEALLRQKTVAAKRSFFGASGYPFKCGRGRSYDYSKILDWTFNDTQNRMHYWWWMVRVVLTWTVDAL